MSNEKVSRRGYAKYAAAGIVVVAVAGAGAYYASRPPTATPTPTPTPTPTVTPTASPTPKPTPTAEETLKIGVTLPLTGVMAFIGEEIKNGMDLAVNHYNETGGILGKQIEFICYDDGFQGDRVSTLYEKLITEDKVDIVNIALEWYDASAAVCKKYDRVAFSWFEAARELHPMDVYGDRLVSIYSDPTLYGAAWGLDLVDMMDNFDTWNTDPSIPKPETWALFVINTPYGLDQSENLPPILEDKGFEVLINEPTDIGASDFSSVVSKIQQAKPDVVQAMIYYPEGILMSRQIAEMGFHLPWYYQENSSIPLWITDDMGIGAMGNNTMGLELMPRNWHGGDADYLRSTWPTKYDIPLTYAGIAGYTAIEIIKRGAELAGSTDEWEIRKALQNNVTEISTMKVKIAEEGSNEYLSLNAGQWVNGSWEEVWVPMDPSLNSSLPATGGWPPK